MARKYFCSFCLKKKPLMDFFFHYFNIVEDSVLALKCRLAGILRGKNKEVGLGFSSICHHFF